jgi:hypothetical protein
MRSLVLTMFSMFSALVGLSCGHGVPKPPGIPGERPYVTWVIMSGDRDTPDRDFVCQSDTQAECVVRASRAEDPVHSDVHFYYHAVGAETRYTGSVQIGFFEGSPDAHNAPVDITVREDSTSQSILGIVSTRPGQYSITFDVVSTVTATGRTQPIRDQIPITVN